MYSCNNPLARNVNNAATGRENPAFRIGTKTPRLSAEETNRFQRFPLHRFDGKDKISDIRKDERARQCPSSGNQSQKKKQQGNLPKV